MSYETLSLKARPSVNAWEYYNKGAISEFPRDTFLGIIVDTKKATWKRRPYKELSAYGRRKWENMLVLAYAKTKVRISYR